MHMVHALIKCRDLLLFGKVSIEKGSLDSFYSLPPRLLRWNWEDIRLTTCKLGFHKCANIYTMVTKHIITMHVWFRNINLPSYDIRNSDVKQILDRFAISIILSQQTIHPSLNTTSKCHPRLIELCNIPHGFICWKQCILTLAPI